MITFFWGAVVALALGSIVGSFLNVLIWRLPQNKKLTGRSMCPHCDHQLSEMDLIPVLSFLLARGRCSYCHKKISWRYPVIELTTGFLFAATWWILVEPTWQLGILQATEIVKLIFVLSVFVVVFVIDYEHYLILDKVVLPAAALILLWHIGLDLYQQNLLAVNSLTLYSMAGAITGFLPFYLLWKISKGRWIGLGDAKYGLFLGAVFGFPIVWLVYLIACFVGTAFAVPLLIAGQKQLSSKLPFGTFLSVAAVIALWFGSPLLGWYLRLLGYQL